MNDCLSESNYALGMTSSRLFALVGQRVLTADRVHDYVQLRFDSGDVLNVFNAFDLGCDGGPVMLDHLVGVRVETVVEEQESVRLEGTGIALCIDLTRDSFSGPEALHFVPATGEQVVWN